MEENNITYFNCISKIKIGLILELILFPISLQFYIYFLSSPRNLHRARPKKAQQQQGPDFFFSLHHSNGFQLSFPSLLE